MQLNGLLSCFSLRELLELSADSLITGALEIDAPQGRHRIYVVHGNCVHAAAPDAQGFDALWPLFALDDAPFRFVVGATSSITTLNEPLALLLAQAETLARQWRTQQQHIPSLDMFPRLAMPSGTEQVRIMEEDWRVLSRVDGSRTIVEISQDLAVMPLEVCQSLIRLLERGLVEISERPVEPLPRVAVHQPPTAARQPLEASVAAPTPFFARLLSTPHASATLVAPIVEAPAADQPPLPTPEDEILAILRS